ncbi:MAG: LamG-like jellyroll fold domain-containing protein [Mycobacteriales bacterium]
MGKLTSRTRLRALIPLCVLGISVALSLVPPGAPAAHADTSPPAGTPSTVSADGLPTWQLNGVGWSQAVVGDTVYVTGSFTKARPPGVPVGGAGEVPASNIFAYNITTGAPVAFNHTLNAQGLTLAASPDGSRIYVGGDFTSVDGVARNHIAAFSTATGALVTSFAPSISSQVRAIAVSARTVYVGGGFSYVNGAARRRLAAFDGSGGLLPWAPTADDNNVAALVLSPDGSRLIVGGSFATLNGIAANSMGSLDASTGATLPWAANQTIRDAGLQSGITSLTTDGTLIYGSGYQYRGGRFEGTFAADPTTGNIVWLNDCHGDTYDTFVDNQVLYSVSHAHNCAPIGAFPDSNPQSINMRHALAFTTYATGRNTGPDSFGWNYNGIPDSTLLQWFPDLALGTYTGQYQAAWSVKGNADYVVLAGEFPRVNGTAQQGLVRFAVRDIAPNRRGPQYTNQAPIAASFAPGTAHVSWQAQTDQDNAALTYQVYRSGTASPVYSTTGSSNYWTTPGMGFVDTGLTPGATYTYTVRVSDAFGNTLTLPNTSVTVTTTEQSQYAVDVLGDGAQNFWRLGEPSGSTILNHAGFDNATAQAGVTRGAPGAITGDPDAASTFDGSSTGYAVSNSTIPAPSSFAIEAWVKTTTTSGGKIVGYGNLSARTSSAYDRQIYLDDAGHIWFGVYWAGDRTLSTPATYNDGQWHHIVATLDGTRGMALYVDGVLIGTDANTRKAQVYTGYWRIGGDALGRWPGTHDSGFLSGAIDDVAIYPTALDLSQVQRHYTDSGRTPSGLSGPTDPYGRAVEQLSPDMYWRVDEAGGPVAKDTSPNGRSGTYSGGIGYGVAGAVSGTADGAISLNGADGAIAANDAVTNPTSYSEELWFKTTTSRGGKLIGLGNLRTGLSTRNDRIVYLLDTGQLGFGVWTGQRNTIVSASSYNNGAWHQVVATQGAGGMNLYVDGVSVGTNPQPAADAYTGYWRVGGDRGWGGTSNYFAGSIDEVAVYPGALTSAEVQAHYTAGGGTP